jgi:hypothetical protein
MESSSQRRIFGPSFSVGLNTRLAWAGVAIACAGVLGLAAWLTPDPSGLGTHQQLPFYDSPCSFVLVSGLPCPTCGMTTAFAYMMHGHPLLALKAQPAGAVFCLVTMGVFVFALNVVVRGRVIPVDWDRIGAVRLMLGLGFLILGGWGFKIAHGLLTGQLPMR